MKKIEDDINDDLRSEYDLQKLRVRKMGSGRRSFGDTVRLDPDVAEVFPTSEAVNEALRSLIKANKEDQPVVHSTEGKG